MTAPYRPNTPGPPGTAGLGGYDVDKGPGLLGLPRFEPHRLVNEMLFGLPQHLLVPLKLRVPAALLPALLSLAVVAAAVSFEGTRRLLRPALLGAAALLVSILPTAQVFRITWGHQGTRCLYLPVALALLIFGCRLRLARPATLRPGAALALAWAAACIWNGAAWTQAHREVSAVLAAMRRNQAHYPSGSTVFVDAHDTLGGAYVFRNGLPQAAALLGLRADLTWVRGTSAQAGVSAAALGRTVFDLGPTPGGGRYQDLTPCVRISYAAYTPSPAR